MGVKNYTSISCHSFLLSPPPVAEQAKQLAQDAQEGGDQIKGVEHGASPMVGLARIIGAGRWSIYVGLRAAWQGCQVDNLWLTAHRVRGRVIKPVTEKAAPGG